MQVHHARQSRREAQTVLDASVSVQPHQRVTLRDVVQEAAQRPTKRVSEAPKSFTIQKKKKKLPVFVVSEESVGPIGVE